MGKKEITEGAAPEPEKVPAADPVYTVEEFAASSQAVFGLGPDLVVAAFAHAGIREATKKEAEKLVKQFASIKVQ